MPILFLVCVFLILDQPFMRHKYKCGTEVCVRVYVCKQHECSASMCAHACKVWDSRFVFTGDGVRERVRKKDTRGSLEVNGAS